MKVINQTWRKLEDGSQELVREEIIEVDEPEPTLEERVLALEIELSGHLER